MRFRKKIMIQMDDCREAVVKRKSNGVIYDVPEWLNPGF